jgi:hypothetical protein
MTRRRIFVAGIVAAGLMLGAGVGVSAGSGGNDKKKPARPAPGRPAGVDQPKGAPGPAYPIDPRSTIRTHRNARGETVYAVAPSHFDISPPLHVMAAGAATPPAAGEEDEEGPTNPLLPLWRIPRSKAPDPVVQSAIPPEGLSRSSFAAMAPVTGFNFAGITQVAVFPSDSNGTAGNNQFVEVTNVRYQVWSLNRANSTATSILGPANINTLWSGFGGPCQVQNSGDPIVLYDKLANRWLISQFTTGVTGGFFYQCVALSTTANATGTYTRWAFAVPGGVFGDYPHFGTWRDAYYMMAHGFTGPNGSYVGALFAALDRPRMLAGDPDATWQVILDSQEGGHVVADFDGFAPPPTNAPGIFLSLHGGFGGQDLGMRFYRMKVDFTTPANTVRTVQGTAPLAAATAACLGSPTGSACIPQPGTTRLLSVISDRLMFRGAYRNFVDHESIVVSHSVDPAVAGLVSGVRWYDFRLSGTPDASCPAFPCTYQQGTIADVAGGRDRWMSSIAMDGAENVIVGYSTSGKTNLVENHTIRYTGRAKDDPAGQMTVPETIIATGLRNNSDSSRWGDYTSLTVDPFDDCTLWHTNQYYVLGDNFWSTRIASAAWPAGSGPGQCQPSTCTARPAGAPAIGAATVPGPNQIQVTWSGVAPQPGSYAIERAVGACGSEGLYRPLAAAAGSAGAIIDTTVQGGITYSYRVIAAADAAGRCQALSASACVSATATGTCNLKPEFAGAAATTSNDAALCGVRIDWTPAVTGCPLTPTMRYNIFRGTTPDFIPSAANRIVTCAPGPASHLDTVHLESGVTYYYVVRAEDNSTGNGGECSGGNEESNGVVVSGTPYGTGFQAAPGTWSDGGGDGSALLRLNAAGAGNTADTPWRFVRTVDDPGANHTAGGAYAYRNAGPGASDDYSPLVCAEVQTPPLTIDATSTSLQFWERHQIEYNWDGIVVEYARNGGAWTGVPAPSNSIAAGCGLSDAITDWETLSCTQTPPINACGYATTTAAYTGPLGGGTSCADWATGAVTAYAHRCHPIAGLVPGDTIQFRWRFASDPGAEFAGFYLDDVAVLNARLPNACVPDICAGQPNGAPCDDGVACTAGAVCTAGACGGGAPVLPAPVNDSVRFDAGGTLLSWTDPPGDYNVYRGLKSAGVPWAYNQACLESHVAGSQATDTDAPGIGGLYFYLITRVDSCGESSPGQDSLGQNIPNPAPCP